MKRMNHLNNLHLRNQKDKEFKRNKVIIKNKEYLTYR